MWPNCETSCNHNEQQPFRVEHSNKDLLAKFDQSEWGKWRFFLAEALIEASGLQKWVQTNGMAGMPESPRDVCTNRIKWERECSTTWTKLSLNLDQTSWVEARFLLRAYIHLYAVGSMVLLHRERHIWKDLQQSFQP